MKSVLFFAFCCLFQLQGFSQCEDSLRKELRFSTKQLYAPGLLVLAGLLANGHSQESVKNEIAEDRNRNIPRFKTNLDDYLQFSPFAIAYGLDAIGIKSKTDLLNRSVILLKGEILAIGTATLLKKMTHELRPDGSAYTSFPSGHTTQAFAAATFLSEEYKDRYKWMPYASYTVASSVGILRVANNRHYISDVLVGAGIGFLSMKVAYWTHQYKWGKRNRMAVLY
ncbi:phosphatase PAP2 family protein [Dyadobacter sp. CY356]|uniref:phosphatase PAP2 family protein n=1 Tax=Dyadobacter sp. CY356 TaxID=2906442 RepID=UPI001F34E8E7|nr:phosphatase PAP2 family protein [Dyadobacter sp. CY356]MCF0058787.1 phosphatase PAP2 family protein [Dyadobacter sp. CY356]